MRTRILVPVLLGIAGLTVPYSASAQTGTTKDSRNTGMNVPMTPPQECEFLQKRFDDQIAEHANSPKAKEAKDMRAEGGKLCSEGKSDEGVAKLHEALKAVDISAVPD
jgi:hypothetical protein